MTPRTIVALLSVLALLAACGQMGPLVHPNAPAPATAPSAAPTAEAPAAPAP